MSPDLSQLSAYDYALPSRLIAQTAVARGNSRLLQLCPRATPDSMISHHVFSDIADLLQPTDCLVVNNTQVMKARLFAKKASGGACECLIERVEPPHGLRAMIRANRAPKVGSRLIWADGSEAEVVARDGVFFQLAMLSAIDLNTWIQEMGSLPLPPYIHHAPDATDEARYQTIYARKMGAAAAPTAGLHFSPSCLQACRQRGIQVVELTLHVGAGTFQPVKVPDIHAHHMHAEWFECPQSAVDTILATRANGGRVVAVGTTTTRALESASRQQGQLAACSGDTDLFITPGYRFRCVDAMITNFHLPRSTLLMMICAFAGYQPVMDAYAAAIAHDYRFFSYGDAMLVASAQSSDD